MESWIIKRSFSESQPFNPLAKHLKEYFDEPENKYHIEQQYMHIYIIKKSDLKFCAESTDTHSPATSKTAHLKGEGQ